MWAENTKVTNSSSLHAGRSHPRSVNQSRSVKGARLAVEPYWLNFSSPAWTSEGMVDPSHASYINIWRQILHLTLHKTELCLYFRRQTLFSGKSRATGRPFSPAFSLPRELRTFVLTCAFFYLSFSSDATATTGTHFFFLIPLFLSISFILTVISLYLPSGFRILPHTVKKSKSSFTLTWKGLMN